MSKYVFRVLVRITHPSIDPMEITRTLGMEPQRAWRAGDRRSTPKGRLLKGCYQDSYWIYGQERRGKRNFLRDLEQLVRRLQRQRMFLHKIASEGGRQELYIQLPGSINIGDTLSSEGLAKIAELKLALSIEVFPNWERTSL